MRDLDRLKEKVVIELDNHQVALAILGFIVVCAGTFAAGVVAGQRIGDGLPGDDPALSQVMGQAEENASKRQRTDALVKLPLGTRRMDQDLAKPPAEMPSNDPTEAARIEAQRQLAAAMASPDKGSVPVPVVAPRGDRGIAKPPAKPLTWIATNPSKERRSLEGKKPESARQYALEVSAFASAAPAEMVATQLRSGGHAVNVRQLSDPRGQTIWRVEVGEFADMTRASTFQRQFERTAGYSTVMIPIP